MAETFDVVVLGGGTGGYSCALRAAGLGLSVALVEKAKVGGTCLHWGCIPTKAFLHAAEVAEHAKHGPDLGVKSAFDGVDIDKVIGYKNGIVDANWKGLQATLKGRGVTTFNGHGTLTGPNTISVETDGGSVDVEATKAFVLATGSRPKTLPFAEVDGELVITSDEAMYMERVPSRPIVLGASAVGVEFATVWNGYGADEVTIIEAMDAVVPLEDIDTQKTLKRELKKNGITAMTGEFVEKVEKGDGTVTVTTKSGKTVEGDLLMLAIGRGPVTDGMNIEATGVTLDRGFITVDEYCRTGVTFGDGGVVYAIGDVIPTLGLAHASFMEGMLVANQVAGEPVTPIDYRGVPKVYYCTPEIGAVGYTEQELKEEGIEFDAKKFPFSHNARAMMQGGSGHVKVLAAKGGGKVLGVHIVGPHATDLIAEGQMIYNWEALPTDVAEFIHPHPTLSEAVGEAHMALAGRALHG
ncbi:Dihydrolipoamide dehydrogenase of branched-chain alpha-keto acid dehydrogenase [Euzebya pacifica]|uniref:Dihydrolipoyl dehydrogenase n=1 Tax=Euzebya pacifica TaxID=1608957 RepID=A0A346XXK8_9ACTN|nr:MULTISPECIES: dihydrolipoyl dehydrogenase [Euzebya]AXV06955.1 Dihydrolipoamide dehydrogenase of branched-chain alpha-keto acid dehydrogenase [Euzebya pacifica]